MPKRKSFIAEIHELKAQPGKRAMLPFPGATGLYVRCTDRAGKSFYVVGRRKVDAKQIWAKVPTDDIDIDAVTEEDLDEVRIRAREAVVRIRRGEEPFPPPPAGPDSLKRIAENFMVRHVRKERLVSGDEIKRHFERYIYPTLGDRPITEIRRSDIATLLDKIEDNNGSTQADRVLATLRKLFNWHTTRDDDFVSPVVKGMARTKPAERRRQRVMSDLEIRTMWPMLTGTYGAMLKVLLLTAQRLGVVKTMRWQDIDHNGVWNIPTTHKREKAHAGKLPLPRAVLDIIEAQPEIRGNPNVFAASRGPGPFNGFPKSKVNLDNQLREALGGELEPWVLHSLRHTAKTIMARVHVSEFDSERTLGHVVPGIGGIYNHHDYTGQKGAALEKLAAEIEQIVNPPPADDKVVQLRKEAVE